jgi:hypothetical protein
MFVRLALGFGMNERDEWIRIMRRECLKDALWSSVAFVMVVWLGGKLFFRRWVYG